MVQSNKYYKYRAVGVTSEVGLTTDWDLPELSNMTSFIPPRYRKSRGTTHYTTLIINLFILLLSLSFFGHMVSYLIIYKNKHTNKNTKRWNSRESLMNLNWVVYEVKAVPQLTFSSDTPSLTPHVVAGFVARNTVRHLKHFMLRTDLIAIRDIHGSRFHWVIYIYIYI